MSVTQKNHPAIDECISAIVREESKDLLAFGTQIDFTPLFEAVSQKLGFDKTIEFPVIEIRNTPHRKCDFHIKCESENIVSKCGVFGAIMDTVILANFGSSLYEQKLDADGNVINRSYGDNRKAEMVRIRYTLCIDLNFKYTFASGGSNGNDFCSARYNAEDGWHITFVK